MKTESFDRVSAQWLAEFLGIAERSVRDLAQRGYFVRVTHGKYDARQCLAAWYSGRIDRFYYGVRSGRDMEAGDSQRVREILDAAYEVRQHE